MKIVRIIDHRIYPRKCVSSAIQAYSAYCSMEISPISDQQSQLAISTNQDIPEKDSREVLLGFLNYALDTSIEVRLEEV
jgi:hypothetical protein